MLATVDTVTWIYIVIEVLAALGLIFLILMHSGKGGGLSDMFGGGVTSNLGASGVAERNLNRITVMIVVVWFVCIIVLGLITKFSAA